MSLKIILEMKDLGLKMSELLDKQNGKLENINEKADKTELSINSIISKINKYLIF